MVVTVVLTVSFANGSIVVVSPLLTVILSFTASGETVIKTNAVSHNLGFTIVSHTIYCTVSNPLKSKLGV